MHHSLIPNLSYVSEAAAYTLDCQLQTNLVPYTDVVYLSSKSFHYPFWDRHSFYRKKKPLPSKPGSFQVFLKGFKDANVFLREHPWPDQYLSGFRTNDSHRKRRRRWADNCRPSRSSPAGDSDSEGESAEALSPGPNHFVWTETLKQSFREELEKLVILDYIMRNTDRGLDNWMVKVDWETQQVSITSEPIEMNLRDGEEEDSVGARPVSLNGRPQMAERASYPYKTQRPMKAASPSSSSAEPQISIGAIDNSLSWPWKHPDAWRRRVVALLFCPSYPFSSCSALLTRRSLASHSDGSSFRLISSVGHSRRRQETTSFLSSLPHIGGVKLSTSSARSSKSTPISRNACSQSKSPL